MWGWYEPLILLSDFWAYKEALLPINSTYDSINVTLNMDHIPMWKLAMM